MTQTIIDALEAELKASCRELGDEHNPNNYNSDYFHHAAVALAFLYVLRRQKPQMSALTVDEWFSGLVETRGAGSMRDRVEALLAKAGAVAH